MKLIKNFLLMTTMLASVSAFARQGGDDVGNGGFAYKQSVIILKMAVAALEDKIRESTLSDLVKFPERRWILSETLSYRDLDKFSKKNQYRGGRKLAMNYIVNPPTVIVLKPYFEAFAGKTDTELEDASLEVQKRLLHEAAHIWGYKEDDAEKFAIAFLQNVGKEGVRPSNDIAISSDFCACLNGKADIINNSCVEFCAAQPVSDQPILYVNTIIGPLTKENSWLGNLYNWCSVQFRSDSTAPQCMLNATDGTNELNIPVSIALGSNSFKANITTLAKNRPWILKLKEIKTGTDAQTKEFQLRRIETSIPSDNLGALKVIPINQYTCINYGLTFTSTTGPVSRDSYARLYYYFATNETPAPMPPSNGPGPTSIVCHDEISFPGNDSVDYDRLELIHGVTSGWDKSDPRFISNSTYGGKLNINKILETRLANEYNLPGASLNLFNHLSTASRPNGPQTLMAYYMSPFTDTKTGKSFCPTAIDYSGNEPLMNLLGDYIGDTEGLYLAEKEAEVISSGDQYKTIYGTMLTTERFLKTYGFYIENGIKIRIDSNTLHTKAVYFYGPFSNNQDPLVKGSRKLFTVKGPNSLTGSSNINASDFNTTDKRIGCVPKG